MLCDKTWPNWVGMPKEGLKELLKVIDGICSQSFSTVWQFCYLRLEVAILNSELAKCEMVLSDDVKLMSVRVISDWVRRNDLISRRMFCLFVEETRVDVSENQKCCRVRTSSSHFHSLAFLLNIYLFCRCSVEVGRLFCWMMKSLAAVHGDRKRKYCEFGQAMCDKVPKECPR